MVETENLLEIDARVGDFRICGVLGQGAMGEVYLARDLVLGRQVALKLLRRRVIDAEVLERFLAEARTTAAFSHPNIVTLHHYGEHDGRPYLALEHVDGESLRARLQRGPLSVAESLSCAASIAEALGEAHRHGLVHADLKPENVMIGRDGRVRVVDFGLARLAGSEAVGASGTPAYMAPERWRAVTPAPSIDVWSLGIILHEIITGHRPFTDAQLAQLAFGSVAPPLPETAWASLVSDCLRSDPATRPSAQELVASLRELLAPRRQLELAAQAPFPGLAAFSREHAPYYFGRSRELDAVVELLRDRSLVPVTGPSGIGKSSFVRAGLVQRLEASEPWTPIELRPGADPFAVLAHALATHGSATTAAELRASPDTLALRLHDIAKSKRTRVLLFVDQMEELFTLAPLDADAFCDCLGGAATVIEPWRIVCTIRGDYLESLTTVARMRTHLGAVFPLTAMSGRALADAIIGPLAGVDHTMDPPSLVDTIVADVEGQPASLPLLQFACSVLWERRDVTNRVLRGSDYTAIGGASGALATHAEHCLAAFSADQVRTVRRLLLSLVASDGTRRPRRRAELVEHSADAVAILDHLLDKRLLISTLDVEGAPSIELPHEALATAWPRLARWLDETHEQRILLAEIEQGAELWERRGRRTQETWTGAGLAEAVRKIEEWNVELGAVSRAFLRAGVEHTALARRRRRWGFAIVSSALALAAIGATIVAILIARERRDEEARQEVERVIAADRGRFELRLEPFDWDPATQTTRQPAMPRLRWVLQSDPDHRQYSGDELVRGTASIHGGAVYELVEARSGAAVLEIDRGPCAPSVIALRRLPGYHERSSGIVLRIAVPTCEASATNMVTIPEGPFLANVDAAPEGAIDERHELPSYQLDRTEVTRGAFAVYERMAELTGESAAPAPHLDLDRLGGPRLPIVGVNFDMARAYCRYLGKDLPTVEQWQKAVRGGLVINGVANPAPARETPWITATTAHPANLSYGDDASAAPVGTHPDDRSPYDIVDLAGNVLEWTVSRPPASSALRSLRVVVGGGWDTPAELHHELIRWRNTRPDRYLDFGLGFRCARTVPGNP